MKGKITLEEACMAPDMFACEADSNEGLHASPTYSKKWDKCIVDIAGEELKTMEKYGCSYTVLSLTVPKIQNIHDQKKAEAEATKTNDWIANEINGRRDKLAAFACLFMHDAKQKGEDPRRCITKYDFHGALLTDFQHAGKDGSDYLYYGQSVFDLFWQVVQELDVLVYLHPAAPADYIFESNSRKDVPYRPSLIFSNGVSLYLLGMISNSVSDRFPKLKVIVGHLGEHIPFDFWRINHWFGDIKKPNGMVAKKTLAEYFDEHIWLGADRILFSVYSPYETYCDGFTWFDDHTQLGLGDKIKTGRSNAKALLKIDDYVDHNVPVTK
ncbi:Chromatin assembly factor 1 subunit [Mucor velutinosus]|uniref:Chromatin assembly factor 1 subunit n=1 Tax=Mucor velutinosus TaxID=708070 RepID=A0AAN7DJB1_9FUNG|nr:Chromatin assembly factor 1 subunit [Mucor velutinosus]